MECQLNEMFFFWATVAKLAAHHEENQCQPAFVANFLLFSIAENGSTHQVNCDEQNSQHCQMFKCISKMTHSAF